MAIQDYLLFKSAATTIVLSLFSAACEEYGIPSRVKTGKGGGMSGTFNITRCHTFLFKLACIPIPHID